MCREAWLLYGFSRTTLRGFAKVVWRPHVEGLDNVPDSGPVILASNHLSFIDSVMIPMVAPRRVSFLAKAEYFEGTGVRGWAAREFFNGLGTVPVERSGSRDSVAVLETALSVLDGGGAFGIYPEGTRSRDGQLYRGRTGVGWLALRSGAPVVPVGLIGTDQIQPVGSRVIRPRRFVIKFGEPLDLSDCGEGDDSRARRAATDRIMDKIAELTGQSRVTSYNTRPPED
jgi:1-acyl-sn-glycerol-3-phosphate acyltransferase